MISSRSVLFVVLTVATPAMAPRKSSARRRRLMPKFRLSNGEPPEREPEKIDRPETVCVVMLDPEAPAGRPYQVKMVAMTPQEYDTYLRNKKEKKQQSPE